MLTNAESSATDDNQGLLPMPLAHNSSSGQEQQVIIPNSQSYLTTPTSTNTGRYYEPTSNAMVGISHREDDTNNNETGIISSTSVLNLGHQSHSVQPNGFVYEYYKLADKEGIQWR